MTRTAKIMVVEDDILILVELVDMLAECGLQALPCSSADSAMALCDTIDGLVTDIDMPGTRSGLDLAWHVHRTRPGLPIVVVSGGRRPLAVELPPGAIFLPKPYRLADILAGLAQKGPARAA